MAGEKRFEERVKRHIESHNGWQVKFFANQMTKKGIPDILSCINGYFVAIEVKAENGRPSELQKHQIKKINSVGGIGLILYPQDFEIFKKLVNYLNVDNYTAAQSCAAEINERGMKE